MDDEKCSEDGHGHRAILAELAALVATLQQRPQPIETSLAELVESALRYVPGAEHAGITVMGNGGESRAITTLAATDHYPALLDKIQQHYHQGPCVAAAWEHQAMVVNDLATDPRWPQYRREAVDQTPIRSILSFGLFVNHTTTGALNFYANRTNAFTDESVELGLIFATHIALAWSMLRRHDEFQSALASRDVIGQAKGIIMERYKVDAVQAFELLKALSQRSNLKLVDIAHRLVEADLSMDEP